MSATEETEKPNQSQDRQDDEYGDFHKIILQGMISSGFLDLKGVKGLFNAACEYLKCTKEEHAEKTSMPYVQKVVRGINEQIKPFNMAIKSASCELSGKKYFVFLITVENSIVKMQMMFTKLEIEIFQKCMDGMLRKYANFSLPLAECINILRDIDPRASLTQADEFIMKMIELQYFAKYMISAKEFDVTLGVRGIREFEPLLVDLYRDVVMSCSLCKMILLHGYRCPGCKILFHKPCYSKYVLTCKQCKSCNASWLREKEMIRRTRITDEVTEEGEELELGNLSLAESRPSTSALSAAQAEVPSYFEPPPTPGNFMRQEQETQQLMPTLEPMVGSRRPARKTRAAR